MNRPIKFMLPDNKAAASTLTVGDEESHAYFDLELDPKNFDGLLDKMYELCFWAERRGISEYAIGVRPDEWMILPYLVPSLSHPEKMRLGDDLVLEGPSGRVKVMAIRGRVSSPMLLGGKGLAMHEELIRLKDAKHEQGE